MATTLRYGPSTASGGHGPTHRLPGGALPEAPPGLGPLKAHSSLIVNRQAEDGGAVDAPGPLARGDGGAPVVIIPARQARAFRVIDNRTSELTSWDTDLLPDALAGAERPGHLLVRRRIAAGGNGRQDGPGRHP